MSLERLYYNDPFSNIVISCDMKCEKDDEALTEKLRFAILSVPALSEAICLNEDADVSYKTVGHQKNLNNIVSSDQDDETIVFELMAHPFDLPNGESIKIVYKPMHFGYTLYFCLHHIIADAKSLILLMKQALKEDASVTLKTVREVQVSHEIEDAQARYLVATINKLCLRKQFDREDYLRMHRDVFCDARLQLRKIVVEADELAQLKKFCKEQGISVTAHIASEVLKLQKVDKVCLPVDTRRAEGSFGNFVGRIDIVRKTVQKQENIPQAVHKAIRDALKDDRGHSEHLLEQIHPQFYDDVIFDVYGKIPNLTARRMAKLIGYKGTEPTTFVSNLKEIQFQNQQISNLCFYPPHPAERYATLGVVTHGNQMVITVQKFRKENRNE